MLAPDPTPSARRALPFHGFTKQWLGIGGLVAGAPVLLHLFHLLEADTTALWAGCLALAVLAAFSVVALQDGVGAHARGVLAASLVVGALGCAGASLWAAVRVGAPIAKAALVRVGETHTLGELPAGRYRLALHTDALKGSAPKTAPRYRLAVGDTVLEGAFERRAGASKPSRLPGQTSAEEGPEWAQHPVTLGGATSVRLVSRDAALDGELGVLVYPASTLQWAHYAALGLAFLLACLASAFDGHLRRQFILTPVLLGVGFALLAAHWVWVGDPLRPLLGAGAVVLIPGWLAGKLLAYAGRALPWRAQR